MKEFDLLVGEAILIPVFRGGSPIKELGNSIVIYR